MIPLSCTECDEILRVADQHAGRRIRCKHCGAVNDVPHPDDEAEDYDTGPSRLPPKVALPKSEPSRPTPRVRAPRPDLLPRPVKNTLIAAGVVVACLAGVVATAHFAPGLYLALNVLVLVAALLLFLTALFGLFYDAMVAYGPTLIPGGKLVRVVMFTFQEWKYAQVHYIRFGLCLLCLVAARFLAVVVRTAQNAGRSVASSAEGRRPAETTPMFPGKPRGRFVDVPSARPAADPPPSDVAFNDRGVVEFRVNEPRRPPRRAKSRCSSRTSRKAPTAPATPPSPSRPGRRASPRSCRCSTPATGSSPRPFRSRCRSTGPRSRGNAAQ